jgi:NAD(P)-dependent dehydrogenase (short-subunit alcohol dehydrogenase family)
VQPDEVADAVRWLCGAAAASVNGQAIAVCGGETQ